jgi:hypothetical protein
MNRSSRSLTTDRTEQSSIKSASALRYVILFSVVVSLGNIITMLNQSSGLSKHPEDVFAMTTAASETKDASAPKQVREVKEVLAPKTWSDVKLLVYMTTHLPEHHVVFLPCWNDAIQRLDIFKNADGMIYTPIEPSKEQLDQLPFRTTTIKKVATNIGYQEGAVQAMVDPFVDEVSWFDGYDWVIKLNPDVLVREDTWLIQTMLDSSIDVIVHECLSHNKHSLNPTFHSDFIAFRPNAVDRERLLQTARSHAEHHITNTFRHLYDQKRFAYVEGGKNVMEGACRIAGLHSPVLHVHELANFCPYYYNATNGEHYR